MKILILSSSSLHFPLDIQTTLKEAGLEAHRLQSLNEFISSPLRKEPFLAILEVGNTEDIDRALVAYEWAETVQPLAAGRYLLLVGSKHISLQEKSSRFRGVEIAQLPLPVKNLLFKVELQLKVLVSESKAKAEKKIDGFTAEIREVNRERVMVIRGMGPKEGGWKNSGEAPQGRIRWRWIDDPPKKGRPEEKFTWSAESKTSPVFNAEIDGWEVKDPEGDLQCHRGGKEIYSAKKAGLPGLESPASSAKPAAAGSTAEANAPVQGGSAKPAPLKEVAPASRANPPTLSAIAPGEGTTAPSTPAPGTASPAGPSQGSTTFTASPAKGVNPLRVEAPTGPPASEEMKLAEPQAASNDQKREVKAAPAPAAPSPGVVRPHTSVAGASAPVSKPNATGAELPKLAGKSEPSSISAPSPAAGTVRPEAIEVKVEKLPEESAGPAKKAAAKTAETERKNTPQAATQASGQGQAAPLSPHTAPKAAASAATPAPPAESSAPVPAPANGQSLAASDEASSTSSPAGGGKAAKRESEAATLAPASSSQIEEKNEATEKGARAGRSGPAAAPLPPISAGPVRAEVITTVEQRPVIPGQDSRAHFPEQTKEITGKIVIPTTPSQSDHQNLVRSADNRDNSERNVISSSPREAPESSHVKSRLFLTLTLEEMQDQNSSWLPVEGFRIYLSARHRYYGLRDLTDIFPLWIYEGELPPEFLDLQKSWKFYDRLPQSHAALETLPAPVARYLAEMVEKGASGRAEDAPAEIKPPATDGATPAAEKFSTPPARESAFRADKPAPAPAKKGIFGAIKRILGMND